MKRIIIGLLIVIFFSYPYVFFAMYQDFKGYFALGLGLMVIMSIALGFFSRFSNWPVVLLIGNLISFFVSYYFNNSMVGIDRWDWFFKPFTSTTVLIIESILILIPQVIGLILWSVVARLRQVRNKNTT